MHFYVCHPATTKDEMSFFGEPSLLPAALSHFLSASIVWNLHQQQRRCCITRTSAT
jgi:hypothetical protein